MAETSNLTLTPWTRLQDNFLIVLFLVLSFSLLLFFFFFDRIVVTVPAGHGGVLYRRFLGGTVTKRTYAEGLQLVQPWDYMTIYDTRLQEIKQDVKVLSKNGLTISLTVSVRFRLIYEELGVLHKSVGPDYLEKTIKPVTIASVREVIGKYRPEELYTTRREEIQDEMLIEAIEKNGRHPILFEDIIIRILMLPQLINDAIESKLKHEQLFLEYEFRLQREAQEAKRKLIEAHGRQRFQSIVSQSLTPDYLQWRGIQATLKLAESPNTKIIVIGGRKDGLPIILNTETYQAQEETATSHPEKTFSTSKESKEETSTGISQETPEANEGASIESPIEDSSVNASQDQTHHSPENL